MLKYYKIMSLQVMLKNNTNTNRFNKKRKNKYS